MKESPLFYSWTQPVFIMLLSNNTNFHPSTFLLLGIPRMEGIHTWLSVPFCLFTWALSWEIYLFYLLLEQIQTYMSPCTSSSVCSLWLTWLFPLLLCPNSSAFFGSTTRRSVLKSALYKYFLFIHSAAWPQGLSWPWLLIGMRQSAILWDILLSWHRVIKNLGLAIVFCGVLLFSPQSFMLWWLSYCRPNIIPHTYCKFMALIKLACSNTRIYRIYSLTATFLPGDLDFSLILCSYVISFYTVFHLPSKAARLKTSGTCGSRVCVILVAYTPTFFSFLTHRFGHHVHLIFISLWITSTSLFHLWWIRWSMT